MAEHGTYAGEQAHRKAGELICEPCRLAANTYCNQLHKDLRAGKHRLVVAAGAARRLAALVAIGWTYEALGAELGVAPGQIGHVMHYRKRIRPALDFRICVLFDRVQMNPRPSAHWYAQRRNALPPPLAWDEETIDDPDAQPAEWRRPAHALNRAEDIARDAAELMSYGESPENVAQRLGVTLGSMQTAIRRAALRAERSVKVGSDPDHERDNGENADYEPYAV